MTEKKKKLRKSQGNKKILPMITIVPITIDIWNKRCYHWFIVIKHN